MENIHQTVKEAYAKFADKKPSTDKKAENTADDDTGCCQPTCCSSSADTSELVSAKGYTEADLNGPAAVGNLGIGCGNPTALAEIKAGEVVVDLGSGAGFDALLAAPKLGEEGRFIGIDMTKEMLGLARKNAVNAGFQENVEFREGLIEELPVASESVDVIISNCVINLSPDKKKVFEEAFRVLKSGGRLAVSDIVLTQPLPAEVEASAVGWVACVSGANLLDDYVQLIADAGFQNIAVEKVPTTGMLEGMSDDPLLNDAIQAFGDQRVKEVAATVVSASIRATKP